MHAPAAGQREGNGTEKETPGGILSERSMVAVTCPRQAPAHGAIGVSRCARWDAFVVVLLARGDVQAVAGGAKSTLIQSATRPAMTGATTGTIAFTIGWITSRHVQVTAFQMDAMDEKVMEERPSRKGGYSAASAASGSVGLAIDATAARRVESSTCA